jgi:signal transduction histidine kinase
MQPSYNNEVIVFFIAATIIVTGAAVFFFILIRIQHKRKQLYQKQLLEKEFKTREESFLQFSRDLHDEIGSSLSGINMLGQLAKQQLENHENQAATQLLQKINTYTAEMIGKVSDMAWLLKPGQDSLVTLVKKIKTYSFVSAASKNIQVKFDVQEMNVPELSIHQRKAIYLISKEAINNAVKYADCKNIYYQINSAGNTLRLLISDDGKGFSATNANEGNGLKNMQVRAEEIKAVLTINSSPCSGTTIELEL